MSNDLVKYAFIAGEISSTLFGRTDLTKYDLAVAEGHNFFVDYRGGLSTRPGFEFTDLVYRDDLPTKFFPFAFSPDLSNTYLLLFGEGYIRFLQDGAYVLTTPVAVSGVVAGLATAPAHGLATGIWGKLGGRTLRVGVTTANTFQLTDPLTNLAVLTASAATTFSPIYQVVSPYSAADLAGLTARQYRDRLTLTHLNHPVRTLTREDHDNWALSVEEFSPDLTGPDITSATGTAPDLGADPPQKEAQTIFAVTAVDKDGDESAYGNLYRIEDIVNYTVFEGSVTINWPAQDATKYNVYRSIVASEATLLDGTQLGYVGSTRGTSFTDPNITPDFARSPPLKNDPFAPGRIKSVEVTGGGAAYVGFATPVTITDPTGTGFDGEAVIDSAGAVVNVIIKDPGSGYTAPVVVFGGAGAGATGTAEVAPLTGTYPSLSEIFQQRQTYMASGEQPITVWGSRYKRFSNFNYSELQVDNDSYEFDLDTPAISPIRHSLVTRGGLLLFTQTNIWLLNGGAQGNPLTATNALAEPQTFTGISALPPMPIDSDVLYREGKGYAVRLLSYSEASRVYGGEDKSILANHLFGPDKDIIAWAYQESPFKVVWCVRSDGALLAFTVVKPEDVFAWTPGSTRGKFLDVIVIREGNSDRVYVTTQRKVAGRYTKFVERMDLRDFVNVEDAWCVDAGLSLPGTTPAAEIVIVNGDDSWYGFATAPAFTADDVGKYLRVAHGIFRVTEYSTPEIVKLALLEEPQNFIPESGNSETWPEADWTLDAPVTTLSGLWHLEGETVSILGDGNVFPQQQVVNGSVTLSQPVTRCIVGLGYTCRAKSLPLIVPNAGIEAKRKRIVGLGLRLDRTRGLKNGPARDRLYEMRERTGEAMGRPTRLINGVEYQMVASQWDAEGQTYFEVSDPLPATILSLVFDMEVGDDPD